MIEFIYWYLPFFFGSYKVIEFITSKPFMRKYTAETSPQIFGQYFQGIIHVQGIVFLRLCLAYFPQHEDIIHTHSRSFCVSFFVFDTLFIILKDWSQWPYLPHHIASILMGFFLSLFTENPYTLLDYIFYVELSNICLTVWELGKRNKKTMQNIYDFLTPFFTITYVPLRVLYLPYLTYRVYDSLNSYKLLFGTGLSLILGMSLYFSRRVVETLYYKTIKYEYTSVTSPTFTDRIYKVLKTPDFKWWPILTYICKCHITLHYIIHIIPSGGNILPLLLLTFTDVLHIFISFTYYIYDCTIFYEKLDFLSINIKIVVNTFIYFWVHRLHTPNSVWDIAVIINILFLILSCYTTFAKHKVEFLNLRVMTLLLYTPIFILGVGPIILHNFSHEECVFTYSSILAYALGGLVWMIRLPEAFIPTKYLNSLGWMHIFIIFGDLFLIHNLSPIVEG
jgi:hypothetical protein